LKLCGVLFSVSCYNPSLDRPHATNVSEGGSVEAV
jgi:hypothetical protein